jgi:hypothetical protein
MWRRVAGNWRRVEVEAGGDPRLGGSMSFEPTGDAEPIPEAFHSFESDGPFRACSSCGEVFGEDGVHLIEKAFQRGETVYEYALCQNCHEAIRQELSQESKQRIEAYLRAAFERHEPAGDLLEHCLFSGRPLGEDYLICGMFAGPWRLPEVPCFAISGEEMQKMAELMSVATRKRLDDFVDDVLGIPGLSNPMPVLV